ncbi:MAG: hypothetical protein ACPGYY_08505 [Bacteroidia bacterium]
MRQFIAIISVLTIFSTLLLKVGLIANYAIQYDRYNELCENKNKPELECHGSCKLGQEMNILQSPQNIPVLNNLTSYFIPMFFEKLEIGMTNRLEGRLLSLYDFALPKCCSSDTIDHPPQAG